MEKGASIFSMSLPFRSKTVVKFEEQNHVFTTSTSVIELNGTVRPSFIFKQFSPLFLFQKLSI